MSVRFVPVSWTPAKWVYDAVLVAGIVAYLAAFFHWGGRAAPGTLDDQTLSIRAYGTCAFILLTLVLAIGPLARLDRRFLPCLYNRRHFGVLVFFMAAAHATAVLDWYFAYSSLDPWRALLVADTGSGHWQGFPFIPLGVAALLILAIMAATSHDFWLAFLGPATWKALHMAVYAAYGLVVAHVGLGALQDARETGLALVVASSCAALLGLHLAAALSSRRQDEAALRPPADDAPWIDVGASDAVPAGGSLVVRPEGGEAVAIFNDAGRLSAISNLCAHQNGPLGEGRLIDGCVVCPWHGYQYRVTDGCAPAPFTERIATYTLAIRDGRLLLDPRAHPPGTPVAPVTAGANA
ncbi:Rieske 2Fe-2S domain-containing protein [uncultured Alsobacter sp.]|uniref:Rieske 2Fe-2S domain-containing protein n=1 Tax=uncultured Alsobacter sp. TaxID=1748258 RepID=UPI0025CB823E|nr:Rieske 2Fe-2S domain-containing protein [uncultured Alsobacter sp.]